LTHGRADYLDRELPKNGDVPNSPLPKNGSLMQPAGKIFNLKIHIGLYHRCHRRRDSMPTFSRGNTMKHPRRQFLHLAAGAAALPPLSKNGSLMPPAGKISI
jgi:hypothetical protein